MSTAFASSQERLGASLDRLAYATATVLPGSLTVDGIFSRRTVEPQLGSAGFLAEVVDFDVRTDAAQAAGIAQGSLLSIGGETWEVLRRVDDRSLGRTKLDLVEP